MIGVGVVTLNRGFNNGFTSARFYHTDLRYCEGIVVQISAIDDIVQFIEKGPVLSNCLYLKEVCFVDTQKNPVTFELKLNQEEKTALKSKTLVKIEVMDIDGELDGNIS